MKAYLVTVLVVDHDEVGSDLAETIKYAQYNNDCVNPSVIDVLEADIGDWTDEHLLNQTTNKDVIKQSYQWIPTS